VKLQLLAAITIDIDKVARRAADLTRQLLVFSHRQEVGAASTNINRLIQNMDKLVSRFTAASNINKSQTSTGQHT